MALLKCPVLCHSEEDSQSHSIHLHSKSSTSSSLSSQPSLPSVPSLTPPSSSSSSSHHQLITTLKGHSSHISSLILYAKFLYSASSNSEIRGWSRYPFAHQTSGNTNNLVALSNGAIKSLVILGNNLFSAHQDNKIRVWKIENNLPNQKFNCIATLPTFSDRFSKFFSPKNYIEIRKHKKCTWVHHIDTVSALAVSNDGSLLYSASWDRSFKIWQTSDFKCLESVANAHEDAINALVLSNNGFVYTGSADKKIKVWKKQLGDKKHSFLGTLEKHKSTVNALAISNDGSVLYSGACDRSILVWEAKNGDGNSNMVLMGAIRGHTKAVLCLAAMEDLVCSGSADNSVRIWRRGIDKSYSCLAVFEGHKRPVKCLAAVVDFNSTVGHGGSDQSGSSYLVYSGSLDCDVKVWKIWVPLL